MLVSAEVKLDLLDAAAVSRIAVRPVRLAQRLLATSTIARAQVFAPVDGHQQACRRRVVIGFGAHVHSEPSSLAAAVCRSSITGADLLGAYWRVTQFFLNEFVCLFVGDIEEASWRTSSSVVRVTSERGPVRAAASNVLVVQIGALVVFDAEVSE